MKNVAGSGETISGALSLGGRIYHTLGASYMTTDTADGTDNKLLSISSAGDVGIARGASIVMRGNEYPDGDAGKMKLYAQGGFLLYSGASSILSTLDANGCLSLNGGQMYLKGDPMTSPNATYTQFRIGSGVILARGVGAGDDIIISSNAYLSVSAWLNTQTDMSAYFSIGAGSFSWGTAPSVSAGSSPSFTSKMTLSNTGDLNVTGNITAANTKSLSAYGAKSASQGILGGSSLSVYKRALTIDGVTVNVLCLD